jgi:hypothetical protein
MKPNSSKIKNGELESPDQKAERIRQYKRDWARRNPEKVAQNARKQNLRQTAEGYKARKATEYREKNPDRIRENYRRYYNSNIERVRALKNNYKKLNRLIDPCARIAANCRVRIRHALKNQNIKRSKKSIELIGCSYADLKTYIEKQFTGSMSWANYGLWHIDHIAPCSRFNLIDEEQRNRCFHYSNMQPLWAKDNLCKSNKLLEDKTYKTN